MSTQQWPSSGHLFTPPREIIQSRDGSVLTRGFVLKGEYSNANHPDLKGGGNVRLKGARNLRAAEMGIYGTAQPTDYGIHALLSLLGSDPVARSPTTTVWCCVREEPIIYIGPMPYVLRDADAPYKSIVLSDRVETIEGIERRLKEDIISEARRYGGIILVQDTLASQKGASGSDSGQFAAENHSWVAAHQVRTIREVFEETRAAGFAVDYHRIPVWREQRPEDRYLDEYLRVITDAPLESPLVFNCARGVIRTTFAMTVALLIRRQRVLDTKHIDPFNLGDNRSQSDAPEDVVSSDMARTSTKSRLLDLKAVRGLRALSEQEQRETALLRLVHLLEQNVQGISIDKVYALMGMQPELLASLRRALMGHYDIIQTLLSVLEKGAQDKMVVDVAVDHCDKLVNLRENVLARRLRTVFETQDADPLENKFGLMRVDPTSGGVTTTAEPEEQSQLPSEHAEYLRVKSFASLERYMFLIIFAAYLRATSAISPTKRQSFSVWLQHRNEVIFMVSRLRKTSNNYVFAPVQDLSLITTPLSSTNMFSSSSRIPTAPVIRSVAVGDHDHEAQISSEWAHMIVNNRSGAILRPGMILKNDHWPLAYQTEASHGIINFRKIPKSNTYGLSQPSQEGIDEVLRTVLAHNKRVNWVNLREEPLIYINGDPYVLRQKSLSLRNVKSYSGISAARLEHLEDRLRADILAEMQEFEGRILLHSEHEDGHVSPVWVNVMEVKTLRQVMNEVGAWVEQANQGSPGKEGASSPLFTFTRLPMTSEDPPSFGDVHELFKIAVRSFQGDTAVVVNCQLGRGRSTRSLIYLDMVHRWLRARTSKDDHLLPENPPVRPSFTIVNNLLRVIRSGHEVKLFVDTAVTDANSVLDLLAVIDSAYDEAVAAQRDSPPDMALCKSAIKRGLQYLRAYFYLLEFGSFLFVNFNTPIEKLMSENMYTQYFNDHPVLKTIELELDRAKLRDLESHARSIETEISPRELSLEAMPPPQNDYVPSNSEEEAFVAKRSGRILSAFTILKSDFFVGLQKMSLPERVDGAPNFREVPMNPIYPEHLVNPVTTAEDSVFGSGMPSIDGLYSALERMGAHERPVVWTSMREEPVIYVAQRPHVLRLFSEPLTNVVTTGITASAVESIEESLKQDIIKEILASNGHVLLHDETMNKDGSFNVIAQWHPIDLNDPSQILTPKEVFQYMRERHQLRVSYERLPVTDEQAPIPDVYNRIEERTLTALESHGTDHPTRAIGFTFNCQMGRGRTTTGMIAAALVYTILFRRIQLTPELDEFLHSRPPFRDAEQTYMDGEYKNILALVGVLPYGRLAKRVVDHVIDTMEGVQNLRKAIFQFRVRLAKAEPDSPSYRHILHMGTDYLYRYGSLITFGHYLILRAKGEWHDNFPSWNKEHSEVRFVLQRRSLD